MRTVTSIRGRPSSSSGIDVQAGDPARLGVPRGPHAEQREDLARVVAGGAHRGRAPDDDADRLGELVVAGEQRVGELRAGLVGEVGRQRARVDAVHVAAGREHVEAAAGGRAGRAGDDVVAVQAADQRGDLVRGREQLRQDLGSASSSTRRSPGRPSWCRRQERAEDLELAVVVRLGVGEALQAQDRVEQAAQLLALRHLAEDVQAVADLQVLDLAQVAVDVLDQRRRSPRARAARSPRSRGRGAARPRGSASRCGWRASAASRGPAPRRARSRRAAARAGPSRRRSRRASSAARGGRSRPRGRGAWPACPRRGR